LLMKNVPKREAIEAFAKRFPDADPSAVEACLVMLRTATDLHEALDAHFARHGISQGRFAVLMRLLRAQGEPTTQVELADQIGVTRATITGLVDGLEHEGLVARVAHPTDRRKHIVELTDQGRTWMQRMLPDHFRRIAGLMDGLTKNQRGQLVKLLDRVQLGISAIREP